MANVLNSKYWKLENIYIIHNYGKEVVCNNNRNDSFKRY